MVNSRFGVRVLIALSLIMFGCSSQPIRSIQDASDYTGLEGGLIAFSIAQSDHFPLRSLELMALEGPQEMNSVTRIKFGPRNMSPTIGLYSLPAGNVRFGKLRFYAKGTWWETQVSGPEVSASKGNLTYLGRIQAESVQLKHYANSPERYPEAVKLAVEDFYEEDLPRIYAHFELSETIPATKAIPNSWSHSEFVALSAREIPGRQLGYETWITGPVGPELPTSSTETQ